MPYASITALPESVRNVLPEEAQRQFLAVFNTAWREHNSLDTAEREETSFSIAWGALRRAGWHKTEDGHWTKEAMTTGDFGGDGQAPLTVSQGRRRHRRKRDLQRHHEVVKHHSHGLPQEYIDEMDEEMRQAYPGLHDQTDHGNRQVEKLASTCKYCDASATKDVVWDDGRASVPCCDTHVARAIAYLKQKGSGYDSIRPRRVQKAGWTSVMVALYPPLYAARELAVPGGLAPEDLHVTLAYFGDAEEFRGDTGKLAAALAEFAAQCAPFEASVGGIGRFTSVEREDPFYASIDSLHLPAFRHNLIEFLEGQGFVPDMTHGFVPHLTLCYLPQDAYPPFHRLPIRKFVFDKLSLVVAGERQDFQLGQEPDENPYIAHIVKVDAERRYTFSLVYKATNDLNDPQTDTHNEFMTEQELFDARKRFVERGDRSIWLQHGWSPLGKRKIGEWVDIVQWPYPVDATFHKPDGTTVTKTIPANSVYAGVIWEPFAWEWVKQGRINGFSFGGYGRKIEVF